MLVRGVALLLVLTGMALAQPPPQFELLAPSSVSLVAGMDSTMQLTATYSACPRELSDVEVTTPQPEIGGPSASGAWGPCENDGRVAQLAFPLRDARSVPMGTHSLTLEGEMTVSNRTFRTAPVTLRVLVPFAADPVLTGPRIPEVKPGAPYGVEVTVEPRANAPSEVALAYTVPDGWRADGPHLVRIDAGTGAVVTVEVSRKEGADKGPFLVDATVRSLGGSGPDYRATWTETLVPAAAIPTPYIPDENGPDVLLASIVLIAILLVGTGVWVAVRTYRGRRDREAATMASGGRTMARPPTARPEGPVEAADSAAEPFPEEAPPAAASFGDSIPAAFEAAEVQMREAMASTEDAAAPPAVEGPADARTATRTRRSRTPKKRAKVKGPQPPPPPRHVNVHLARPGTGEPLPRDLDLAVGRPYVLRVDVGEISALSAVENARDHALPEQHFPAPDDEGGHWLDVAAVSDAFSIDAPMRALYLPARGPAFSCGCARGSPHRCAEEERQKAVDFSVRAPEREGEAALRLIVYVRNNVVQSQLLRATVRAEERRGDGYASRIDYQLGHALTSVASLARRDVSILTNHNASGTHRLVMRGDDGTEKEFAHLTLSDARVATAAQAVRDKLFSIHAENGGAEPKSLLDASNGKTRAQLEQDLLELARLGWTLHHAMFEDVDRQIVVFQQMKGHGATVQIARAETAAASFPFAAIYDLDPVDPPTKVCRSVREWREGTPLVERGQMTCRYASDPDHAKATACPFGFWGFRHLLEHPPTVQQARASMPASRQSPRIVVALHAGLAATKAWETHEGELGAMFPDGLRKAGSRAELREALQQDALEVLYLYCHGKHAADPYLLLGRDEPLPASELSGWSVGWKLERPTHWAQTSPLVFMNGCRTADMRPEDLMGLVGAWTKARAAAVLGTEIMVVQSLANEVARVFLGAFAARPPPARLPAGKALAEARTALLAKGNLLGLAYTLYGSLDLHLVEP